MVQKEDFLKCIKDDFTKFFERLTKQDKRGCLPSFQKPSVECVCLQYSSVQTVPNVNTHTSTLRLTANTEMVSML